MYLPLTSLPASARIWIYQSQQPIPPQVSELARQFVADWTAHNQQLLSSSAVLYDHFLVLAVDEGVHNASGCSIDRSVHFVQSLETAFGLAFFDRLQTACWQEGQLVFKSQAALKEAIKEGTFDENTLIFNNLIQTLGEMEGGWQIRAADSWLSRLFAAAKA